MLEFISTPSAGQTVPAGWASAELQPPLLARQIGFEETERPQLFSALGRDFDEHRRTGAYSSRPRTFPTANSARELANMATETLTMMPTKQQIKAQKMAKLPPENERFMRACSDIANALIQDYESQRDSTGPKRDINLNRLRAQFAKKHKLSHQPPLTAIISAVPEHYKKYILPKLIAKPISECTPWRGE